MAAINIRRTSDRKEIDQMLLIFGCLLLVEQFSTKDAPAISNGTTAGRLRTNASVVFSVGKTQFAKASTDDLWNLSAQTALAAAQYRAYWLLLDNAGAATIAVGTIQSTALLALGTLPALDGTKSVIGVYVAGPSTNFASALAAQGTIYNGIPDGARTGVGLFATPQPIESVGF